MLFRRREMLPLFCHVDYILLDEMQTGHRQLKDAWRRMPHEIWLMFYIICTVYLSPDDCLKCVSTPFPTPERP